MIAKLNGATIAYRDEGIRAGPPVTLIGGIGNDMSFWDGQAEALADRYRLIRFDLRGHGGSEATPPPYDFALAMGDIVALWDHLGVERSHVMGLGMGGAIALNLAAVHGGRILKLVGAGCRPTMDPQLRQAWLDRAMLVEADGIDTIVQLTVERWFDAPFIAAHADRAARMREMLQRTPAAGYAAWSRAFAQLELFSLLPAITAPTLFLTGEKDVFGGNPELVALMSAIIPDAGYVVIPGVGHLCNIEDPQQFNGGLLSFLAR